MHIYSNEKYLKALDDYSSEFGESFPTECVKNPDRIIELIYEAIEEDTPYDPYEELKNEGIDPSTVVW